jgi:hypothetical protein
MNFLIFDRSQRHAIVPASAETCTSCPDWTEILTVNKKEAVLYPSGDGSLIFLITSISGIYKEQQNLTPTKVRPTPAASPAFMLIIPYEDKNVLFVILSTFVSEI